MIMIIKYLYITWLLLCKSVIQGTSENSTTSQGFFSSSYFSLNPSTSVLSVNKSQNETSTNQSSVNGVLSLSTHSTATTETNLISTSSISSPINVSPNTAGTGNSSTILASSILESIKCSDDNKTFCENGGRCFHDKLTKTDGCVCSNSFYGNKCQYKAEKAIPHVYKQLAYGFGGTTMFLLLVVIVLTCCCSKSRLKNNSSYDYSKELDDFTIANKRASVVKPSVLNAYDVYAT